jgi:hypothetical protein
VAGREVEALGLGGGRRMTTSSTRVNEFRRSDAERPDVTAQGIAVH